MRRGLLLSAGLSFAAALSLLPLPASAQQQPPAKAAVKEAGKGAAEMDHAAMHAAHMQQMGAKAEGWKELDAYHALMMATWHPAKDKSDLAPTRSQIGQMVAAAKAVAGSTAPSACQKPAIVAAQGRLVGETDKVAALVAAKADDATLKAAMKTLHDRFELLEEGCSSGMKH